MEVGVRVEAENPMPGETPAHQHRLPDDGRARRARGSPAPVPPPLASTPDEQRRLREAEMRRANRLAERAEMLEHRRRETADETPADASGRRLTPRVGSDYRFAG